MARVRGLASRVWSRKLGNSQFGSSLFGMARRGESGAPTQTPDALHSSVSDYYGKTLKGTEDLLTNICTIEGKAHPLVQRILENVPQVIKGKDYGCGAVPLPLGIAGCHVLDLGSGSGKDCYVAAALVGESGSVTGIDMTDEQLETSRKYADDYCGALGYKQTNMRFLKGYIENIKDLGVKDESIDIATSNCVVNLASDKEAVLKAVWNALKWGGEFQFSDIYCDRRIPEEARKDETFWNE